MTGMFNNNIRRWFNDMCILILHAAHWYPNLSHMEQALRMRHLDGQARIWFHPTGAHLPAAREGRRFHHMGHGCHGRMKLGYI
jgi:hypothetical protein